MSEGEERCRLMTDIEYLVNYYSSFLVFQKRAFVILRFQITREEEDSE
jgi:hypothetical protein